MSPEDKMREGLFSAEPTSPERQQRFREELLQIVRPRLSSSHRLYYKLALFGSVVGILGAACGLMFDAQHRWTQGVLLLVWAAGAGWAFHILRRGAEPLRAMQGMSKALAGITGFGAVFLVVLSLHNPSLSGVLWALLGMVVFLLMSFINLWNRTILAERTMREHVLRVEYRVIELASQLSPPTKP